MMFATAPLQSLCENTTIFVGRSFSYGITAAKSDRLQPLKYNFIVLTQSL